MSKSTLKLFLAFSIIILISQIEQILSKEEKIKFKENFVNEILKKKSKNPKVTNKSESSNFFGGKKLVIDPNAPRNQTDSDGPFDDYTDPKYDKMDGVFNTDECLVSKDDAKKILQEKYGISYSGTPDVNLRFILGNCNPILFLPGIYATRLMITINC